MICYGISDNNRRRVQPGRTHRLAVALAILICEASAPPSQAQLPQSAAQSPANTEPTARIDPLGRETPRSVMLGFLKYTLLEDYETAARYLQPPPGQDMNLEQWVKELRVLHQSFRGDIALLSNDPNGTGEEGLPLGQVRAGVLVVGGTTSDVILVREASGTRFAAPTQLTYLSSDPGVDAEKANEIVCHGG